MVNENVGEVVSLNSKNVSNRVKAGALSFLLTSLVAIPSFGNSNENVPIDKNQNQISLGVLGGINNWYHYDTVVRGLFSKSTFSKVGGFKLLVAKEEGEASILEGNNTLGLAGRSPVLWEDYSSTTFKGGYGFEGVDLLGGDVAFKLGGRYYSGKNDNFGEIGTKKVDYRDFATKLTFEKEDLELSLFANLNLFEADQFHSGFFPFSLEQVSNLDKKEIGLELEKAIFKGGLKYVKSENSEKFNPGLIKNYGSESEKVVFEIGVQDSFLGKDTYLTLIGQFGNEQGMNSSQNFNFPVTGLRLGKQGLTSGIEANLDYVNSKGSLVHPQFNVDEEKKVFGMGVTYWKGLDKENSDLRLGLSYVDETNTSIGQFKDMGLAFLTGGLEFNNYKDEKKIMLEANKKLGNNGLEVFVTGEIGNLKTSNYSVKNNKTNSSFLLGISYEF